jgi:hypothetical protein
MHQVGPVELEHLRHRGTPGRDPVPLNEIREPIRIRVHRRHDLHPRPERAQRRQVRDFRDRPGAHHCHPRHAPR